MNINFYVKCAVAVCFGMLSCFMTASATASAVDYVHRNNMVRRDQFNTTPNEPSLYVGYTRNINTVLQDQSRVSQTVATAGEKEKILKAVMATVLIDGRDVKKTSIFDKRGVPALSTALLKHFEILRLTEELAGELSSITPSANINSLLGYADLYTFSGIDANTFMKWNGDVRREHDSGISARSSGSGVATSGGGASAAWETSDEQFGGNGELQAEYWDFKDKNPGATQEDFLKHEQRRIEDNQKAEVASKHYSATFFNPSHNARSGYRDGYVFNRAPCWDVVTAQMAAFAPILEACIAVNPTQAQDLDVHVYDAFYAAHNAATLAILRTLRLGEEVGQVIFNPQQALDRAVAILRENGQADNINSVAAQLPGYFTGFTAEDSELFCRLVGIVSDFVDNGNQDLVHYLLGIYENWTTQGGCLQGRRGRNLMAIIPILRTLGLSE